MLLFIIQLLLINSLEFNFSVTAFLSKATKVFFILLDFAIALISLKENIWKAELSIHAFVEFIIFKMGVCLLIVALLVTKYCLSRTKHHWLSNLVTI